MAGRVTGDAKLEAEDKAEMAAGKPRNAIGGMKGAVRDASGQWGYYPSGGPGPIPLIVVVLASTGRL